MKNKIFLTSILALSLAVPAYAADQNGFITHYDETNGFDPSTVNCDNDALETYDGPVDLVADWEAIQYYINFNGGTGSAGSMSKQLMTYDTPTTLTLNGFTKTNNVFQGWTRTQNGTTVEFADGATIGTPNQTPDENLSTTETPDVELYAVWGECPQPSSLTVPANANVDISNANTTLDGVVNNKCTYTIQCAPGYTYSGTGASQDGTSYTFELAAGETTGTVNACGNANTITVNWYDNDTDANPATTNTCSYGTGAGHYVQLPATNPTKTGYKFKGWKIKE